MQTLLTFFIVMLVVAKAFAAAVADPWLSNGNQADPTTNSLSEIRASEKRRIPIEVQLKSGDKYRARGPVGVTVIITNLFDAPLIMNSRMLVNHPLLQGEVSFRIIGPDGQEIDIERLITPLSVREQDFITLHRGESIQRAVDLTDLFGIHRKGVYKIEVSYHNDVDYVDAAQHAWKGIVWSEPVEIRLY